MEKPYTIGEIGKLLGLSRDAIRFYERKGLVHPLINSNNRYRLYTFKNVLELLDIIYYRHLDIPVDTIYDLSKDMDPKRIVSLMDEKVRQTRRKIYYETQLLKKLEHIQLMFHEIERQKNVCSIKQFPTSLILFQGKDKEAFFSHDIQYLTQDQFAQSFGHQWKEVRNSVEWRKALERKRKELCNGRLMMNIEQLISFDYTIFIIHRCIGLADSLGASYNFV